MTLLTTWAQTALVWVLQSIYKFYKATKVVWDPLWDLMGSPLEVGARRAYSAAFLSRLPPGPEGRTFWGILCGMAEPLHLLVQKFRARFGDCLSFYMGGECMVVLSSYKMVKKAFTGEALAWRPQIPALVPLLQGYGKSPKQTYEVPKSPKNSPKQSKTVPKSPKQESQRVPNKLKLNLHVVETG